MIPRYYQVNNESDLFKKEYQEASIYFCTNGKIYMDLIGIKKRKELGGKYIRILNSEEEMYSSSSTNNDICFVIQSKKIYLYHDNIWICFQNGSDKDIDINSIIFHTNMIVVNDIGGIKSGDNLNGLSVSQILNKLIYPYIKPSIKVVAYPDNGGLFEKGNNRIINSITVTVYKKSEFIKSIQIFKESKSIGVKDDSSIKDGGSYSFDLNIPVKSENIQIMAKVTDMSNISVYSYTNKFNFVYPYFTGITKEFDITASSILSMKKTISVKTDKTIEYSTNNDRMVFAYPKVYGKLRKIIDQNKFDITASFILTELNIECIDKTVQPYYVYANAESTVKKFMIEFKY